MEKSGEKGDNLKGLDEKLTEILNVNKVAGMAVAVTDRKGIIYQKGFGVDNIERPQIPAEADAHYKIASITKLMTGMTIMRLVEKNVLSLDMLVKDAVSWLKLMQNEALDQMTLRHLLSHTSGLPKEYTPDGPREESMLEDSLKKELAVAEIKTLPCEGVYLYSNLGIRLASYIAEQKTGERFSKLVYDYVLNPLDMNKTTFDLHKAATYPLSLPHEDTVDGDLKVSHYISENAVRLAAGGLYSNTSDLCKLARVIINGGVADSGERILSLESIKEMTKVHGCSAKEEYGLTMMIKKYKDRYLYGHYGSAPPYALSLLTDPESGYGVVTLMNTERNELRYKIPELVFEYLTNKEIL